MLKLLICWRWKTPWLQFKHKHNHKLNSNTTTTILIIKDKQLGIPLQTPNYQQFKRNSHEISPSSTIWYYVNNLHSIRRSQRHHPVLWSQQNGRYLILPHQSHPLRIPSHRGSTGNSSSESHTFCEDVWYEFRFSWFGPLLHINVSPFILYCI